MDCPVALGSICLRRACSTVAFGVGVRCATRTVASTSASVPGRCAAKQSGSWLAVRADRRLAAVSAVRSQFACGAVPRTLDLIVRTSNLRR